MTTIVGLTNPGNRPGENQDSIGWDEKRCLALVADGLGGHAGGQVASRIVKETVLNFVGSLGLPAAVLRAHSAIVEAAKQGDEVRGMASTIVAVQIKRNKATVVWVGDSRAYLWRGGVLTRLTRDHSVVEELRASGGLSETQVRTHPLRNEVTNVLGAGEPEPDRKEIALKPGDWIMLCSDGLHGELRDEEMAELLAGAASSGAPQKMVDAALEKGGRDNVSVVVVAFDGSGGRWTARLSDGATNWLAVLGGIVLAVLIAAAAVWIGRKR
jgi:serine/threonine protein phosphatase PrpC